MNLYLDQELYDYMIRGAYTISHYQSREANYGTEIWKKNAEFIKNVKRDLQKMFLF